MIKSEWFFWLVGAVFLVMAAQMATDRTNPKRLRLRGLLGPAGRLLLLQHLGRRASPLPAEPLGVAVLVLIVPGRLRPHRQGRPAHHHPRAARAPRPPRFGNKLFLPALTIPLVAMICAMLVKLEDRRRHRSWSRAPRPSSASASARSSRWSWACACCASGSSPCRCTPAADMLESMGWALLLPQLLAVLGSIFQAAGVGDPGRQDHRVRPAGRPAARRRRVVLRGHVRCSPSIMGNAFAAFPVMTAAIGWPVLIEQMNGNAAAVLAIGMLAGFCGTLVTPMAANFNLVPAALLELKDQYGPDQGAAPHGRGPARLQHRHHVRSSPSDPPDSAAALAPSDPSHPLE